MTKEEGWGVFTGEAGGGHPLRKPWGGLVGSPITGGLGQDQCDLAEVPSLQEGAPPAPAMAQHFPQVPQHPPRMQTPGTSACAETHAVSSVSAHLQTQISPSQGIVAALSSTALNFTSSASQEFRFSSKSLGWAPCEETVKKNPLHRSDSPFSSLYLESSKPVFNPFGVSW